MALTLFSSLINLDMPGCSLSKTEEKLLNLWKDNNVYGSALESIKISGENGIRGLKDVEWRIGYPVSVLCGKNGSGKTTLLSLAALAFHFQPGYHAKGANVVKNSNGETYYTFQSFFFNGPKDSSSKGVAIKWSYKNGKYREIVKKTDKWMHYDRRPSKAVCFLSTSRILSPMEQRGARTRFKKEEKGMQTSPLNDEFIGYLNEILGRKYSSAQELRSKDSDIRVCENSVTYSSFNMGAGEDVVIEMLSILQDMPQSSLLLIEEIEIGIHPAALRKLAKILQKVALKKHMQIIITSHSRDFIDSLPRCARTLVDRCESNTQIYNEPTTSYAVSAMSDCNQLEMNILCEDSMAKQIIENVLCKELRKRVNVSPIGSKDTLVLAYKALSIMNPKSKLLIVWDGDVNDQDKIIKRADIEPSGVKHITLHPKGTPEENLINDILQSDESLHQLASMFNMERDQLKSCLSTVDAMAGGNHHDYMYHISKDVGLPIEEVKTMVINIGNRANEKNSEFIEKEVRDILDR